MLPRRQDSLSQLEPSRLEPSLLEPCSTSSLDAQHNSSQPNKIESSAIAQAAVRTKQNLNLQLREISTSASGSASVQREPKKTASLLPERHHNASASANVSNDSKQDLWDKWRSTTRTMTKLLSLPAPRNLPSTSRLVFFKFMQSQDANRMNSKSQLLQSIYDSI